MRKLLVSLLGLLLVATAGVEAQADKGDKERLQGTWVVVSSERMGNKGQGFPKGAHLTFAGNQFTMEMNDKVLFKGTFTVDSSKKPTHLDLEVTEGTSKGVSQGIFVLEQDTLKWCNGAPGAKDRPTEFATSKEKNHMLVVFERAKK